MKVGASSRFDSSGDAILGVSRWAQLIRSEVRRVAGYSTNTLITGPTGTGKELIARAIHSHSPRVKRPLITIDCAAVTGALFVSHIFGHVRGAFTGAIHAELGCIRAAHRGTVFFDEIGELDFDLQAKLLRVLQERTVTPVGSHEKIPVDVRVIAATNRDLGHDVIEGRFRRDLYYRLNVVALRTIPLRERPEDVEVLASRYLAKLVAQHGLPKKRLSNATLRRMHCYDWPGNVREMENVLERAALFTEGDVIGPQSIPEPSAEREAAGMPSGSSPIPPPTYPPGTMASAAQNALPRAPADGRWPTLAEIEREHIRRTLECTNFNQSEAARLLGMDRHRLIRKICKHGLDRSQSKRGRPPKR